MSQVLTIGSTLVVLVGIMVVLVGSLVCPGGGTNCSAIGNDANARATALTTFWERSAGIFVHYDGSVWRARGQASPDRGTVRLS